MLSLWLSQFCKETARRSLSTEQILFFFPLIFPCIKLNCTKNITLGIFLVKNINPAEKRTFSLAKIWNCSKLIRQASGSAEWTAVFGSEDRSRREIELPITDIRIHPNFANYQNDIGKFKDFSTTFLYYWNAIHVNLAFTELQVFFAEKQKEEAVKKSMIQFMLQRISKRQQKIKEIHPSTMLNCFEIL